MSFERSSGHRTTPHIKGPSKRFKVSNIKAGKIGNLPMMSIAGVRDRPLEENLPVDS